MSVDPDVDSDRRVQSACVEGSRYREPRHGAMHGPLLPHGFRLVLACLAILASVPVSHSAESSTEDPPLVEVVAKVDRSLVHILAGSVSGSGFVFGEPRWIVTNRHVVEEAGFGGTVKIRPVLPPRDGRSTMGPAVDGVVRALHPDRDLAVIELLAPIPSEVRPIPRIAGDSLLPRGTEVLIHGFPATSVPTVSRGIVSGHHHDFADDEPVYLLDGASGSGSSGGPVTDRSGRLVAVANAVYDNDASEELGFAWCFAIPVSHLGALFDDQGRLRPPQAIATVDELVRRVLDAEPGSPRVEALRSAMSTIGSTRSSLLAMASDHATLLERIAPSIILDSEASGRQLMDAMLDQAAVNAKRGAELALGGDESLEDSAMLMDIVSRTQAIGREIMARSLENLDETRKGEVLIGVLDAIAKRSEELRRGLPAAAGQLEPMADGDPQALRGTARESFLSALSEVFSSQLILEMTSRLPMPTAVELGSLPPRVRDAFRRFQSAARGLRASWESMPEAVRSFGEDSTGGGLDAVAIRNGLRADGFVLVADATEDIALGPGGASRERRVGRDEPLVAMAFLAESRDGADIDLELRAPTGQAVAADTAADGFPLVATRDPARGMWTVRLLNPTGRTTLVRYEVWERRGR